MMTKNIIPRLKNRVVCLNSFCKYALMYMWMRGMVEIAAIALDIGKM